MWGDFKRFKYYLFTLGKIFESCQYLQVFLLNFAKKLYVYHLDFHSRWLIAGNKFTTLRFGHTLTLSHTPLSQIPPDFYVSKYQQESKPIAENEFYRDDKDNDK